MVCIYRAPTAGAMCPSCVISARRLNTAPKRSQRLHSALGLPSRSRPFLARPPGASAVRGMQPGNPAIQQSDHQRTASGP